MTCERHVVDGVVYTICLRGQRRRDVPCRACQRLTATLLCDGPVPGARGRRRRCSAPLCEGCRTREGELDLCPGCVAARRDAPSAASPTPTQGALFR